MKRNQAIPTSWLVGLGAAAVALLYLRQRRKGNEWNCYARVFQQKRAMFVASGAPESQAQAMADRAARANCGMETRGA